MDVAIGISPLCNLHTRIRLFKVLSLSWISDFRLHCRARTIMPSSLETEKDGLSLWNFTPILCTSGDMSTSSLAAAIFNSHFRLHRRILTTVSLTWGT
jgi:hypothetical protein